MFDEFVTKTLHAMFAARTGKALVAYMRDGTLLLGTPDGTTPPDAADDMEELNAYVQYLEGVETTFLVFAKPLLREMLFNYLDNQNAKKTKLSSAQLLGKRLNEIYSNKGIQLDINGTFKDYVGGTRGKKGGGGSGGLDAIMDSRFNSEMRRNVESRNIMDIPGKLKMVLAPKGCHPGNIFQKILQRIETTLTTHQAGVKEKFTTMIEERAKKAVVVANRLQNVINGGGLRVKSVNTFGSSLTGLSEAMSDIDMNVEVHPEKGANMLTSSHLIQLRGLQKTLVVSELSNGFFLDIDWILKQMVKSINIAVNQRKGKKKEACWNVLLKTVEKIRNQFLKGTPFENELSDVDILREQVSEFDTKMRNQRKKTLYKIQAKLQRNNHSDDVTIHARARIGLVRYRDNKAGVQCDVVVNTALGTWNSKFLRAVLSVDPSGKVYAFVRLVKCFASAHNMNKAADGYLSSYAWVTLAVHFLLRTQRIPAISFSDRVMADGINVYYQIDSFESKHSERLKRDDLRVMLQEFMAYFGFLYDFTSVVISLESPLLKSKQIWKHNKVWRFSIEDVFERANSPIPHDLGVTLTVNGMWRTLNAIRKAYEQLAIVEDTMFLYCINRAGAHEFVDVDKVRDETGHDGADLSQKSKGQQSSKKVLHVPNWYRFLEPEQPLTAHKLKYVENAVTKGCEMVFSAQDITTHNPMDMFSDEPLSLVEGKKDSVRAPGAGKNKSEEKEGKEERGGEKGQQTDRREVKDEVTQGKTKTKKRKNKKGKKSVVNTRGDEAEVGDELDEFFGLTLEDFVPPEIREYMWFYDIGDT